ncbi:carotenoid oxygenase family protein [Hahella ganghwensis]|uniref:carotenoid oxygenase family protein n=1 Tax=Hahella ganghwensis TaxID=286420 RepID=UPI000381DC3B|nr:carotenoid oxygenase family protein [Hahella ganghwensis]
MDRRHFVKSFCALTALPNISFAGAPLLSGQLLYQPTFPDSIMNADLTPSSGTMDVISGTLPQDISGHVFMAEGIPLEKNHFTPNGRGALTRFDFNPDGVGYLRKMINTPSAIMQEQVSGLLDRFSLLGGTIYFSTTMGFMNYCNTAPNYMGNNRFALSYEGGPPFEFDGETLELVTQVGNMDEWQSSLPPALDWLTSGKWLFPQIRTTGHPHFDLETGECFTINYGGNMGESGTRNGFIRIIRWDQHGPFESWQVFNRQGENAYISATSHSLGVTRDHILIFQTAAFVENGRILGIRSVEPQRHRTPVWIIRKADLMPGADNVLADYIELDFDTSDIVCNYDDSNGEITLYGQYMGAMDKSEPQMHLDRLHFGGWVDKPISGYPTAPVDIGGLVRARIRVHRFSAEEIKEDFSVVRDLRCWDMNDPAYRGHFQFPDTFEHIYWAAIGYRPEHLPSRVANAYKDYPHRVFSNGSLPEMSQPSALLHFDCNAMAITDAYEFPSDCVMRTPQFMNRPGSTAQDDGYLFTAVVRKDPTNGRGNGKEIWIFDAGNLSQGPVCILSNPNLNFATTNHALWVESIGPRPVGVYRSDLAEFLTGKMSKHSREVQQILEEYILPKFS